jgi:hypothetical protein
VTRAALTALAAAVALAGVAEARTVRVSGKVLTSTGSPLAAARVRIEVTGIGPQGSAVADPAGQFTAEVRLPEGPAGRPAVVTLLYSKDGYRSVNAVRECRPVSSACAFPAVTLPAAAGASALSPEEQNALKGLRSQERNTLFLVPFRLEPEPAPAVRLDMPRLAESLRRAIVLRFQDLEDREGLRGFTPLPPVGLRTLPPGVITPDEEADTEKLEAVGGHLNALALITGTGEVRAQGSKQLADVSAGFLALPAGRESSKLWLVEELDVPVSLLSSLRLSGRLSPLWGHSALLAVCRRELAEARAANDTARLRRVRAYLVAERSLAGGGEEIKVGEIDRLVSEIDREIPR